MAEILHQLRLVVYPIMYRVFYIPGGAGFQPSTVGMVRNPMAVQRNGHISILIRSLHSVHSFPFSCEGFRMPFETFRSHSVF